MNEQNQTQNQSPNQQGNNTSETNIWAILGLIFAFLMPIIGLIFSIIGLSQIKKDPSQQGKGLAKAGLIISIVFIAIPIILIPIGIFSLGILKAPEYVFENLPESCIMQGGVGSCQAIAMGDSLQVVYSSNMDSDISVELFTVINEKYIETECLPKNIVVQKADSQIYSCPVNINNGANKFEFRMTYTNMDNQLEKTAAGEISING